MEMLKRKSTLVAAVTLIVGLALGVGIGTSAHPSASAASVANNNKAAAQPSERKAAITQTENWDPFREMQRMQDEIDRTIRHATEEFRMGGATAPFSRDLGYSSSLDVRDRGDHFEVRAYLPDAEAKDVKVTTDGDQTLRVSVTHRQEQKKESKDGQAMFSEMGQYDQLVTLPEPANMKEMKVDTRDNELVVTIPKAKAS